MNCTSQCITFHGSCSDQNSNHVQNNTLLLYRTLNTGIELGQFNTQIYGSYFPHRLKNVLHAYGYALALCLIFFNNGLLKLGEESVKGLAIEAGKKALEMAQVEPEEVDLVVLCTSTPDDLFGSGAQVIRPSHILSCIHTNLSD